MPDSFMEHCYTLKLSHHAPGKGLKTLAIGETGVRTMETINIVYEEILDHLYKCTQ
jgi:hypothetical protein